MGSSGSGSFSDYSQYKSDKKNQGGSSGEEICSKAFSTNLEEIERCDYFEKYKALPDDGTPIKIILKTRLAAVSNDGLVIGYLPTSFNFLVNCMSNGFEYKGNVVSGKSKPVLSIQIDVAPIS